MGLQQLWIGLLQCLDETAAVLIRLLQCLDETAAVLDRIAAVFGWDCSSFG